MRVRCACGLYIVDTEDANEVHDGIPLCPPWTCQKVKEHRSQGLHYTIDNGQPDETLIPRNAESGAYC